MQTKYRNIAIIAVIVIMVGIIFTYQMKKKGFHEDEVYAITTSVNPYNGLMSAYSDKDTHTQIFEKYVFDDNFFVSIKNAVYAIFNIDEYSEEMNKIDSEARPIWRTNEEVANYVTLSEENYLNFRALLINQMKDTHPPFFYTLVHFATILFAGNFTKYSVFLVNIIAFIISCIVLKKILQELEKEKLILSTLIFYGLSMGTISMVIYQRMYMLLTMFIMLYFYYNIKLYKNNFYLDKELNIKLGITTVLGFLTQYYFAIYALFILIIMIIKMIKDKKYKSIFKYIGFHLLYAVIGILLFVPCIHHLMSSERGISNLENTNYMQHLKIYINHLLYCFTIENDTSLVILIFVMFFGGIGYLIKNKKDVFITLLTIIPSIIYLLLVVKLTSLRELRYIMPIIPFVVLTIMYIFDTIISFKYKEIALIVIAVLIVINGFVFSKPKFLFEEYATSLEIAEKNREKPFVFVYDNIFNHIQSVPEMMIYKKSIVLNYNKDELKYILQEDGLENENSYILCIKTYMDNEKILKEIKQNSSFKNITQIHFGPEANSEVISNNLYLVTK